MKNVLVLFVALLMASMGTSIVCAQIPNMEIHFTNGREAIAPCGGIDVVDSLYIVANDLNMWVGGIEYCIQYPPEILWIADRTGGLNMGSSPWVGDGSGGIATVWGVPRNGYEPLIVNNVIFVWQCEGCPRDDIPVRACANEQTGFLRATRYPDAYFFDMIGMLSLICPTVPAEQTTWGNIKALYR